MKLQVLWKGVDESEILIIWSGVLTFEKIKDYVK